MLEQGADPHYVPPGAPFAVFHALAMKSFAGLIPDIVKAGVDVDTPGSEDGSPALHFAANKGHLEAFKALLAAGVNPSLQNKEGQTALNLVSKSKRKKLEAALR
jgi:ankyrin repeat protein